MESGQLAWRARVGMWEIIFGMLRFVLKGILERAEMLENGPHSGPYKLFLGGTSWSFVCRMPPESTEDPHSHS